MPAYRSSAEAEIREPVVARLREIVPGCRIIHEINATGFGNRIDVLAVGKDRIAAVEIKSAKDKLDRLPAQIEAMRGVTNDVFAALHEKFLDATSIGAMPPEAARRATVWVYPRSERKGHVDCGLDWNRFDRWKKPVRNLPATAINILWRDELHAICGALGVRGVSRLDMRQAADEIVWRMTGEEVTKAICRGLRARECVEADPPIVAANDNTTTDATNVA